MPQHLLHIIAEISSVRLTYFWESNGSLFHICVETVLKEANACTVQMYIEVLGSHDVNDGGIGHRTGVYDTSGATIGQVNSIGEVVIRGGRGSTAIARHRGGAV